MAILQTIYENTYKLFLVRQTHNVDCLTVSNRLCCEGKILCFNCLICHYQATHCPSTLRCRKCGRKHHTSLCENTREKATFSERGVSVAGYRSDVTFRSDRNTSAAKHEIYYLYLHLILSLFYEKNTQTSFFEYFKNVNSNLPP